MYVYVVLFNYCGRFGYCRELVRESRIFSVEKFGWLSGYFKCEGFEGGGMDCFFCFSFEEVGYWY